MYFVHKMKHSISRKIIFSHKTWLILSVGLVPPDENPTMYSSKMMDSIWGMYNKYAVHNLNRNTGGQQEPMGWVKKKVYWTKSL